MPLPQRKRRAERDEDGSLEASPEPAAQRRRTIQQDDEVDESFGGDNGETQDANTEQMVKKMVRLALACEYQRKPIRRADISEKVLGGGGGGRKFKEVFARAQAELGRVFGMKMVELPTRERVTVQQRRAAQKQSQTKTPQSYILTSLLPTEYHHPNIIPPPAVPTSEEESRYISIYTLLISLISLSGGQLPDAKMERYLRRLKMEDATPLPGYAKTEVLLKRLEREGYMFKVKEATGTGDDEVYWVVGPRGKAEVGDEGVRGLTRAVFGELDDAEDDELERRIGRSLGMSEKVAPRRQQTQSQTQAKKRRGKKRDAEEEEDNDGGAGEEEVEGDTEEYE